MSCFMYTHDGMWLYAGVTPDPLDYSFVWQLLNVLQAVNALSVEDDTGCSPPQVSLLQ